jgi:hypothetical protein
LRQIARAPVFHDDVVALDITELAEAFPKPRIRIQAEAEEIADARYRPPLLRTQRKRPDRRQAKERNEITPSHQIISCGWIDSLSRSGLHVWP